jgi:hypothetical protein
MSENEQQKSRDLTEMQRGFVDFFTSGGETGADPEKAAIAAGYSEKNAGEIARQLLGKPHVIGAIDAALRDAIGTRLTVQAVKVIECIIRNPDASLKLRGEMAVKIVEFSGLVERTKAQKAQETGLGGKSLAELTRGELEAIVAQGAAVLKAADEFAQGSRLPN